MCNDELNDKQNNDNFLILSWNEYESKIKTKFGVNSKEYLMISLYGSVMQEMILICILYMILN